MNCIGFIFLHSRLVATAFIRLNGRKAFLEVIKLLSDWVEPTVL